MLKIGCHLSSAQGYLAMGKAAKAIGANTFQFFTRNPRGGKAKPFDEADAAAYVAYAAAEGLEGILAHAPYTLNACAADEDLRAFARRVMLEDLQRLEYFPGSMYNFHPGSHVKQGSAAGIEYIGKLLNSVLRPGQATQVLLETMAGKGTEIGRCFEELREIIDRVDEDQLLGVCLDTCHVFDGGYDIVHGLDAVIEEFDRVIGLERLKAVHLNDSMNPFASHKDRHQKIGQGEIGLQTIAAVINHPKLQGLPFYLETPNDLDGYAAEISLLKGLHKGVGK